MPRNNFEGHLCVYKNYSLKSIPKGVTRKRQPLFAIIFFGFKTFFMRDFFGGQKLNENLQVYEMQHIHFNTNTEIGLKILSCKISH